VWKARSRQSAACQPDSPAVGKGEASLKSARTLITLCLVFTTVTLVAQTESRKLMKVNIPFAFSVENHALPDGEYLVFTVSQGWILLIVSTDGKHSAIVNTLPNYGSSPSENSRLVFKKYGNEYFPAQVWTAGQNVGRNPLSGERAMEIAGSGERPQTFTVLALADRR
jgi:hypothetical protein